MATDRDWAHDLFLPTLLFAALGGMTWAVRGCSGYGAAAGCIFAGVGRGTAWWYIARNPGRWPTRRYTSGWIVLAMTVGFGLSGARGWMQWSTFFERKLQTNTAAGEFVEISPAYGFLWLFIAGVPWAGVAACLVAWCGSVRETRLGQWALRLACGIGAALLARYLFNTFPQYFLPLYDSLADRYQDVEHNPNLRRLANDCRSAMLHLGCYLGLLGYEIARRDTKNIVLITTVGLLNGIGWAACQNWKWAPGVWPEGNFNWWRCWESSGGISIGIALGVAYFLANGRMNANEQALVRARRSIAAPTPEWLIVYVALSALFGMLLLSAGMWGLVYLGVVLLFGVLYVVLRRHAYAAEPPAESEAYGDPNLQRLGLYLGLLFGLGASVRNGLKGWFNIYRGDEEYWSAKLWLVLGPCFLVCLVALFLWTLRRPLPRNYRGDLFPYAGRLMALVLVVLNILAQLVTGPPTIWNEFAFSIYYVLLLAITAVIVFHYHVLQRQDASRNSPT